MIGEIRAELHRRGLTQDDFRVRLNENLPKERQISQGHAGSVFINRWLNLAAEPSGEIALAMKKTLKSLKSS